MKNHILMLLACIIAQQVGAQTLLNKSFDTNSINHLLINNFVGSIEVTSTTGYEIKVRTTLINDETNNESKVDFAMVNDVLMIYFRYPCTLDKSQFVFDPAHPFKSIKTKDDCHWHKDEDSAFPSIKMIVEVPKNINVYASTVLGGDISISDIKANVKARNVNGGVHLHNVEKVSEASTINGEVTVDYRTNPKIGGQFKTINGDIELSMPSNPNFNALFKCFQGDLYTDIDNLKVMEDNIQEKLSDGGHSIKIDGVTKAKAGNGGMELNLETFNGNGYLKTK